MSTVIDGPILEFIDAASKRESKLYHATRMVVDLAALDLPDGESEVEGGSGISPKEGWEEFLDQDVFETREYARLNGWQQSCYYGSRQLLQEYTLLAGRSLVFALPGYADYPAPTNIPHLDRDRWTFSLYELAISLRNKMGLNLFGKHPYSDAVTSPDDLRWVFSHIRGNPDVNAPLTMFREDYSNVVGRLPRFVFATLLLDVFTASSFAIRYAREHQEFLFGSANAFDEFDDLEKPEPSVPSNSPLAPQGLVGPVVKRRKKGIKERDRWFSEQDAEGRAHKDILKVLKEIASARKWSSRISVKGISIAIKRFRQGNMPKASDS